MNRFKNFFSSKSRKADELDRFISARELENDENKRPSKSGKPRRVDQRDINATSCYHTATSPKKRSGPKSCPGGYKDDIDGGITNRSFDTEMTARIRRTDREFARDSTRNRRYNRAASEYEEDMHLRKSDVKHTRRWLEDITCEENEEKDDSQIIFDLRRKNSELKRKLFYEQGRHSHYREEYRSVSRILKDKESNFEGEINYLRRQLEEARQQNMMLSSSLKSMENHFQNQMQQSRQFNLASTSGGGFPISSYSVFNSARPPMFGAPQDTFHTGPLSDHPGSFVADPQPTNKDTGLLTSARPFDTDDIDEVKNFRCQESYSSIHTADQMVALDDMVGLGDL